MPTPHLLPTERGHNPSHHLDWKRFCSDLIVDFQQMQIDLIRQYSPDQFITHNFMGFADKVNYFDLAKPLDFASHDQYPMGFFHHNPPWQGAAQISAALDLMRGAKGRTFWIMEQQSGPSGWTTISRTPRPGQLRLWSAHSIAHGADSLVYFRWRTCTFGTEEYWHGILPHSGIPGRRYAELRQTVAELGPLLPEIQGSLPGSEVAILYSYDQKWAFDIQPHHPELTYIGQVMGYYGAFYDRNIPVDFIAEDGDFSRYRLIVAPLQFLVDDRLIDRLTDYVKLGGNLVLTMRSGVKNKDNVCLAERDLPGRLGDLLGLEILDYDCLQEMDVGVQWLESGFAHRAAKWADVVTLKGARALAAYSSEYYAGTPTVTVMKNGEGRAWYVATEPDEAGMDACVARWSADCGLAGLGSTVRGVELARRRCAGADLLFAFNHTAEAQTVALEPAWQPVIGSRDLQPFDYAVFRNLR